MEQRLVRGDDAATVRYAGFGIVSCRVDASYGAIRPGDLLVSSPTPGHAMRADAPSPGWILGKAIGSLETGTGFVHVLETLR